MSANLTAFKTRTYRELYEHLAEVFDSKPFKVSFVFTETPDWIETEAFEDSKGNSIKVYFHKLRGGIYEADFTFNGETHKTMGMLYSVKEYSELLSTIAAVFSQFLEDYSPEGIIGMGADDPEKVEERPETKGQKDRIYKVFMSKIRNVDSRYYINRSLKTGAFTLMRT